MIVTLGKQSSLAILQFVFCQFTLLVPGLLGATLLMGFGILSINWCMVGRSGSADQAGQAEE